MKKILLFLIFTLSSYSYGTTLDEILKESERPSLQMNLQLSESALAPYFSRYSNDHLLTDDRVYSLYEKVVADLLAKVSTRKVFLMARDMEDLYDAIDASLYNHPERSKILERIHVLHISRKVAVNSTPRQLLEWAKVQGLDVEKIARGEDSALLLDTGYASTVFNAIFFAAFSELNLRGERVNDFALRLIDGLEARLLSSWQNNGSVARLKAQIERNEYSSLRELSGQFERKKFFFPEFFSPAQKERAGLPVDSNESTNWVINNIERRRKNWRPRIIRVTPDGRAAAEIEDVGERDARVDRLGLLIYQRKIFRYFTSSEVQNRMRVVIEKAGSEIQTSPKMETLRIPQVGDSMRTPGGRTLSVRSREHDGEKAQVFLVFDQMGKKYALKMANDETESNLNSIDAAGKRLDELKEKGIPHSHVVEKGKNYILKEWVDGQTASERLSNNEDLPGLDEFILKMKNRGIYIGNMGPKNLVLSRNGWVIIDSGPIFELHGPEMEGRWKSSLERRWFHKFPNACARHLSRLAGGM